MRPLSFKKAAFIGFITTIVYLFTIFSRKDMGGYGGMFMLSFLPLVFLVAILLCYLVTYLERKAWIVPHVLFRFLTTFLLLSLIAWLSVSQFYIEDYQGYSFNIFMKGVYEFSIDFMLPIGIATALISILLSVDIAGNKKVREESESMVKQ
ncbi:hypothetical protein [Chitinophaga defluvii]|uniref:Uncharacterized protein n=1 Tax=Chitinophaga defluvii TaxID=3163343 RepID=A0ABV2SZT8_9BACT